MAGVNFIPQLWEAKILRVNEDNLVAKKICTAPFEGTIKKQGDTVYFPGLADPTITAYAGSVTYEGLSDASLTMKIDQADYFAFKVGDIEKAQQNIDLKGSQAERAGYGLNKKADTFVLSKYAEAKNSVTATITTANVLSAIAEMEQKLAENNVLDEAMWMILPPWMRTKLKLAGISFSINEGINGTGGMAWTKDLGFDIYISNQVVNTGTASVPISHILAGSRNAICFADQVIETETLRLQDSFDNAVRGLHVYGAKIVKPGELCVGNFTYGAETTI